MLGMVWREVNNRGLNWVLVRGRDFEPLRKRIEGGGGVAFAAGWGSEDGGGGGGGGWGLGGL